MNIPKAKAIISTLNEIVRHLTDEEIEELGVILEKALNRIERMESTK